MKILSTPKDVRPWWVLLFVMLAALVFVQQAGAEVWTFTDPADYDDWSMTPGSFSGYSGSHYGYVSQGGEVTIGQHLSTYWAYTTIGHAPDLNFYDEDGVLISGSRLASTNERAEVYYNGTHIITYINGEFEQSRTCNKVPYEARFYGNLNGGYFDDIVFGQSEDTRAFVSAPKPDEYFICKDIIEPTYSGFYRASDLVKISQHLFTCQYSNSAGTQTIYLTHVGTGTIVDTSVVDTWAGTITYNATEIFFNTDAPYGLYTISSDQSDYTELLLYKATMLSGTDVDWDNTTYTEGDTATITFSISETYWLPDDYTYRIEVWDESYNEVTGWNIPSRPVAATQTVDINTDLFSSTGTYYCVLTATDKSSGEEILWCFNDCYIDLPTSGGGVVINGETYDAITNSTLASCTVLGTQLGVTHTTTSDGDGLYNLTGLVTDWSLGMNASKTGYIGYLMAFTPYAAGTYTVDIPLVPSGGPDPGSSSNSTTGYYNSTTDGTALGGLCYQGPYWTLGENCTVTVSNSTWNTSCTTGAGGWYQCNNIGVGGTYSLSCSKSGYTPYTTSCSLEEGCFNREDCTIDCSNALTVNCKDLTSLMLLSDSECTVALDTGQECTTSNGTAIFYDLPYGSYTCTASALGYYPGSTGVVMDAAKEVDCYLTSSEDRSGGSGAAYAPKSVKFSVQTLWGKAITNCTVTCCGHETTAGSWSWLYSLFGIDANATPIANSTMTGTTDERGSINFLMLEPVEYTCSFVKTGEINKNITLYPKDEYYLILATEYGNSSWLEGGVDINAAINCTIATAKCNSTWAYINLTYLDTTNATTGGTCYLNQTNATAGGPPVCLQSTALSAGCSSGCNLSFLVNNYAGESYMVNVDPTHSTWDFTRSFAVTFPPAEVNPLGLTSTELMLISTFFIIFTGCLFGAISAPHAPLMMSFMGWICWALGWMGKMETTITAALVLASVLSVLFLVMVRSKKERWV